MLTTLRVRDFAIIDELSIQLGAGLNVLTGETGAGKSIVVEAVHLLLGGRARNEVIRSGSDEAVVEAMFQPRDSTLAVLRELDIDAANDEVLIRRVVSRGGRSRVSVNGSPVTLAMLERLAQQLVDVTGQHEHHSLLRPDTHLELLDAYGDLGERRAEVRAAFDRVRALQEEHAALERDERERAAREDYLQFQLREIRDAALEPGEDEALALERARLRSVGKLLAAAASGEEALYGADACASSLMARVERELSELSAIDPTLGALAERVDVARLEAEDVARALAQYARGLAADPARLQEVEDRLALLARLRRKHGATVNEIIATGDRLAAEQERISRSGERLVEVARELATAAASLDQAARSLTEGRQRGARAMASRVEAELATLALEGARFSAGVSPRGPSADAWAFGERAVGPKGGDRVEFLFAPNAGEEARPLQRIASGGELSRVTLALKNVLASGDPVGTYVFDEVDAGVGGAAGEVLGRKLRDVSTRRQVVCITHLPQIAAFAEMHFLVEKRAAEGRTVCAVRELGDRERKEEIARMLGGLKITARTRAHADEMLRASR